MTTEKELHELYGGKVKIVYYPNSHRYRLDGEKSYLVSASSMAKLLDDFDGKSFAVKHIGMYLRNYLENGGEKYTKAELMGMIEEAIKAPDTYTNEAILVGTNTHDLCQAFAEAKRDGKDFDESLIDELGVNDQVINAFGGFVDWYNSNDVEFLEMERLVYSKKYNLVGRTDAIIRLNGVKTVADYKSGALYPKIYFQNGVYWASYNEEMEAIKGEPVTQGMVINFNKDTGVATPVFVTEELQAEIDPLLGAGSTMLAKKKQFQSMINKAYNK